ncbi:MAG TPA: valine--tRNA ligase [Ktedonobacterales bacterium]
MPLPPRYDPATMEPRLRARWAAAGTYAFDRDSTAPVYSIDTPPATVSGQLHLGHVYSYSHADFIARYQRMRGRNVFYPMGFDDNGLPTERLVEKTRGVTAGQIGRQAFGALCLEISEEAERAYTELWQRLGLSVDWRYTYRSIEPLAQRTSQRSFLDLYRAGLAYRGEAPTIWCPECHTAIAQAELEDLARESALFTLAFTRADGEPLSIATTRPELLPACVALLAHPDDARWRELIGQRARMPLFGREVPVLADTAADPAKGTGAVMCCTFGDSTDVEWWRAHALPLRPVIGRDGRLTAEAGPELAGLTTTEARARIVARLAEAGLLLGRERIQQSVRAHERCDTPVEYLVTRQWFVRALDAKAELLAAGTCVAWHPAPMGARYREWVEHLRWDWCISRQRAFGVPFPVWYCAACGEIRLAEEDQLPLDPAEAQPAGACACGSTRFVPEADVMDTWATSSLSPQIAGRWLSDPALYARVFPFSLRAQAHEIIRTWAFYTLLKSRREFDALPWSDALISGWGLAPRGAGKISKSRGGGATTPEAIIARYSADAARYWAASTGPGKDTIISEEKMRLGQKLITKLWNVARFAERVDLTQPPLPPDEGEQDDPSPSLSSPWRREAPSVSRLALTPVDRWLLARLARLIERVTAHFEAYDYAAAKSEVESFFWTHLTDNYLELAKERLYGAEGPTRAAARYALRETLLALLKLFAPFLPYLTEAIYQELYADPPHPLTSFPTKGRGDEGEERGFDSLHRAAWPAARVAWPDAAAEAAGDAIVAVATAVRRFKSERGLALGTPLARVEIAAERAALAAAFAAALADLRSVTRAREVAIVPALSAGLVLAASEAGLAVAIQPMAE